MMIGRLAQLARALRLHRRGRWFEPNSDHQYNLTNGTNDNTLISRVYFIMRKNKEEAIKLRLSGKSYSQISDILGVAKSTLSAWLSEIIISDTKLQNIYKRGRYKAIEALVIRNKRQTYIAQKRASKTRKDASSIINKISVRELLFLGASLYWAEGYKKPIMNNGKAVTHHAVSLTNADPWLIKLFLKFLTKYCKVPLDRIKGNLRVFDHQNKSNLLNFWHKETNLNIIRIVNQ